MIMNRWRCVSSKHIIRCLEFDETVATASNRYYEAPTTFEKEANQRDKKLAQQFNSANQVLIIFCCYVRFRIFVILYAALFTARVSLIVKSSDQVREREKEKSKRLNHWFWRGLTVLYCKVSAKERK